MLSPLIPNPSEARYQLAHISDNQSSRILISHYVCLPLATIAVILRLLSRHLCKAARLQVDDALVIAAWVLTPFPPDVERQFPQSVSVAASESQAWPLVRESVVTADEIFLTGCCVGAGRCRTAV